MTRALPSQMTTRPAPIPTRPRRVSGGPVTPLTAQVAAEWKTSLREDLYKDAKPKPKPNPKPKAKARRETESAEPRGTRDESIGDASVGGRTPTRERPDPGRSLDAAVGSSEPNAADAAARRAEEVIQAAERRVRELELELESVRRQEDARRTREVKGAEPSSGDALHLGEPESAEKHVSTFREPEPRDSSRADRTAEAAATPAYPVATPAPTPRARLVPNPGAFLEPKLAEPKSEPRDSHVAGPERKTESAAAFVRAPEPEPERSVAERDAPKDASEPPSAVSARLLLEAQTQAQALLEAQTQALLQAQAQALLQVKAQAQAQQLLLQPPAAAQPVFPPSVERESLSLRAPESQSESRLSSARRPRPRSASAYFPRPGSGAGMPPRPPSREREAFDREGGEPITERRASGDARANIAAILSGGDEEKPEKLGGSASSPYAFRAGYAFSAASAPSSPAGEDQDLLAARRGAWAAQSASRAERYREEGDSRRRGLETPPSSLGRDPRASFGGSPSHGADSASAFGAVVATLE